MSDLFNEPEGATSLDPDEAEGLLLSWIELRGELNEAEGANVKTGTEWAFQRRSTSILDGEFIRALHKRMFGDVWAWAGTFRTTEKNIGIDPSQIQVELHKLFDDVKFWIAQETYLPDEIAIRLHHRLTQIHAFPNGNGRHARLMADVTVQRLGSKLLSWGAAGSMKPADARQAYLHALHKADTDKDFGPLLKFARA